MFELAAIIAFVIVALGVFLIDASRASAARPGERQPIITHYTGPIYSARGREVA